MREVESILQLMHTSAEKGGHAGRDSMINAIGNRCALKKNTENHNSYERVNKKNYLGQHYYLQNCSEHVVQYIKNCEACNRAEPHILRGPLQPLQTIRVMELIEVDYFGLLPDPTTDDK